MRATSSRAVAPGIVAIAVALPFPATASASQPVQPGLWEMKVTSEIVDSEAARRRYETLRKRWQNLAPEERRKVEAAVPMPGVPVVKSEKFCLTPEQARRMHEAHSGVEEDEDCRTEYGELEGGRIPVRMTCKEQSATGVGEVVYAGQKAWSTMMRMTSRPPGEPPSESVMRTDWRWLSRDCGSVKPEED